MNKKEVLKMAPGRKIDFIVAQKVMRERFQSSVNGVPSVLPLKHNRQIPQYSANAYSAEKVLEKTREKYPIILHGATSWECQVFLPTGTVVSSGLTDSFSLAICRAALLTVIEEENQDKIKQPGNKKKYKLFLMGRPKYAKER